jgi:hypothetical protein
MPELRLIALLFAVALLVAPVGAEAPEPDVRTRVLREWSRFQKADEELVKQAAANDGVRWAREEGLDLDEVREMERFLLDSAQVVLELRMPFPFGLDAEGNILTEPDRELADVVTEDFLAWASSARMDIDEAVGRALYLQPMALASLGHMNDDPRALAILREALSLDNHVAAGMAALLLAEVDDAEAVAKIIARIRSAPTGIAESFALALAEFSDPEARAVAEEVLGAEAFAALAARHPAPVEVEPEAPRAPQDVAPPRR